MDGDADPKKNPDRVHRRVAHHLADHVAGADEYDEEDDFAAAGRSLRVVTREMFGPNSYVGVFLLALASVVVVPLDELVVWGQLLTILLLGWLVLLTYRKSHVRRPFRIAAAAIIAASCALSIIKATVASGASLRWMAAAVSLGVMLMLGLCLPAILRRAFSHRRVTLNTVAAALAGYLLIGLFFMSVFTFIYRVDGDQFFVQLQDPQAFDFEYFSFITMTTVGYGDLTAANNAGKSMAVLLALTGQIYLVTTVAAVVANLGRERPPRDEVRDADPGPATGSDDGR